MIYIQLEFVVAVYEVPAMQNVSLAALFVFGLIVTGYWSYQAFTRRQFELEETPTL